MTPVHKNFMTPDQREAVTTVCNALNVEWSAITSPRRGPTSVSDARRIVMYLLYQRCGMSYAHIGWFVGRTKSVVRYSVLKWESYDHSDQQTEFWQRIMDYEQKIHDAARRDTTDDGDVGYIPAPGPAADLTGYELPPPPP